MCLVICLVPQVGAQTETELKEKKLRVEDALNATKAAVEEGIVVGGGCALLRLSAKVGGPCLTGPWPSRQLDESRGVSVRLRFWTTAVRLPAPFAASFLTVSAAAAYAQVDAIRETLDNEEQKMGADIVKRALSYPMKLIASNAGTNGSIVVQKVSSALLGGCRWEGGRQAMSCCTSIREPCSVEQQHAAHQGGRACRYWTTPMSALATTRR